jgi:hypothetical protein
MDSATTADIWSTIWVMTDFEPPLLESKVTIAFQLQRAFPKAPPLALVDHQYLHSKRGLASGPGRFWSLGLQGLRLSYSHVESRWRSA